MKETIARIATISRKELYNAASAVASQPGIKDTFKLFLKPFDYLMNAEYITPEMKAQYRQEAIDEGIINSPVTAGAGVPETRAAPGPVKGGEFFK